MGLVLRLIEEIKSESEIDEKFGRHLKKCSHEKVKSYLIAEIEKFEWGIIKKLHDLDFVEELILIKNVTGIENKKLLDIQKVISSSAKRLILLTLKKHLDQKLTPRSKVVAIIKTPQTHSHSQHPLNMLSIKDLTSSAHS